MIKCWKAFNIIKADDSLINQYYAQNTHTIKRPHTTPLPLSLCPDYHPLTHKSGAGDTLNALIYWSNMVGHVFGVTDLLLVFSNIPLEIFEVFCLCPSQT